MKSNITVRGIAVNNTLISSYGRRVNSFDGIFTVWANAATLQVALHGNKNWLDSLFDLPSNRLAKGGLSAQGKQVLAYIQAHCPQVVWNKESDKPAFVKVKGDKPTGVYFLAPGAKEVSDTVIKVGDKFYTAQADFYLTFAEFKNLEKAPKNSDKSDSVTAKAFAKQVAKASEAFKASKFVGTPDELSAALEAAKAFYLELAAKVDAQLAEKLADGEQQVDADMAAQLLNSGQAGKSTRAGGKVEDKAAAFKQ